MMVTFLASKLKHFLLFFVGLFRRALCCFRRRRVSFDSEPLLGVVSEPRQSVEENWAWDERPPSAPRTVQDHINLYRKKKQEPEQEEEPPDFFEDMTPRITKQKKVYLKGEGDQWSPNRLGLVEATPVETGELREWEDNGGWEGETLDWDAQEALREKKRRDRERRLAEQRQERGGKGLGARLST